MSIGASLLRFSEQKLVFFDFESQRLNLRADNLPFELAFTETVKNKVIRSHQYYLRWPNYKMSPDAARITKFNPYWVESGHDPEFVLGAWEGYAMNKDVLLVGHSIIGFDIYLWNLWRKALGRPVTWDFLPRIIDTNVLARAYKMGWKPDKSSPEAFLAWQFKVNNSPMKGVKTNLTLMSKELGIEIDETKTHSAEYDLFINVQVYWKLVNLMEI